MMRMSVSLVVPMLVSLRMVVRVLVARPIVRMGMGVHRLYSTSFATPAQLLRFSCCWMVDNMLP